MNKRTAFIFFVVLALALAPAAFSPLSPLVEAQGQVAFGAQRFPAIEVDRSDNLYVTMAGATAPASERRPHSQIFFTVSRDYGRTWDNVPTMRKLTNSPGEAFGPSIASNKQGKLQLFIVYHDNSTGTTQSYLLRTKKKTKFRNAANITPHSGAAFSPRVAVDSNDTVFVVWGDAKEGSRVALVRSSDLGASFSEPVYVSGSSTSALDPEIAVDSANAINVVWEEATTGAIMFARSIDGGETFSEPQQVSKGEGRASEAHITSDSAGRLSVVWVQAVNESSQAFYSRSIDGGQTFSEPVNVSNISGGNVHKPVVVTYKDTTVYIAFQNGDLFGEDEGSKRQVYLAKSQDAGLSFSDPVQVSSADNSKGRAHSPAMATDSRGMLHIAWIDASFLGKDEGLLFYSNTENGRSFSRQQPIIAYIIL